MSVVEDQKMIRTGMIALVMIIAFQGFACGQGLLDSVLGPGGLGIWGGGGSDQQFNPQATYGSPPGQQQQYYPPTGQQGYPPQSYGTQQGVYPDWQNQAPAAMGMPGAQYGGVPQQYPEEQQYTGQPQQYPAQQVRQQQYPQQLPPQQVQQQQLRPGQYSPNQAPGPGQMTADDLPSGAVRIMTTTPDGTTVQYYGPTGEPDAGGVSRPQRPKRPAAAKPARQKQSQQETEQTSAPQAQTGTAPIAMPKPMELPKQDPRYGWGAPSAPSAR
jgi:hypothetical protein